MDKLNEKEYFLKKLEGREDILERLSLDRLEILNNYYNEIIEKNNLEIANLKNKI